MLRTTCWLLLWCGVGAAETGRLTVRVLDDADGRALPARLVLKASDGSYPGDRLGATATRWPNLEAHAVFIDGAGEFDLPAGMTTVTAARGLEYVAQTKSVKLDADAKETLEFRLKRAVNMKAAGWVAGDLHVHMIHGEMQRPTSYEDVALTCAANGLDFVAVGQEYSGAGELDLAGYHAKCRAVSNERIQVFLGGERPKNILGHQVILGCTNPFLVSEEAPYARGQRQIHAQGGISVYVHPTRYYPGKQYGGEWLEFPGNNMARALLLDSFCGPSFDGLSVLSDDPANLDAHRLWFHLLNRGCFVPVFADSDACFDRPTFGLKAPGFWNTYFHLGANTPLTQANVCAAVRRGRTFATTGPLVQFAVAGKLSGETLPLDGAEREVTIDVDYFQHAFTLEPATIARVELIRSGEVVQTWKPAATTARLTHAIREKEACWYAVRVFGSDEKRQVALTSPIFFAAEPVTNKRPPREFEIRGRIYDFVTGVERAGVVEVRRGDELLRKLDARGAFTILAPLDAEITVRADGVRPITKNLVLDYGPVHRFLWYLESRDFGKLETFERLELLLRKIELEFPLGHRQSGSYVAAELDAAASLADIKVQAGPPAVTNGSVAVAAVLTDAEQIAPGDTLQVAAIFRDEGAAAKCGPYVVEARAYDPAKPTAFGALKKFGGFEKSWAGAKDLGDGYKLIHGAVTLPQRELAGPDGWIDLSIRARQGHGDAAFVGLVIPLGPTKRALTLHNTWPTVPVSWPDRSYGLGPFRLCNRIGRKAPPLADYRQTQLTMRIGERELDLLPTRDCRGCDDAADAMYAEQFWDQVLNEESQVVR